MICPKCNSFVWEGEACQKCGIQAVPLSEEETRTATEDVAKSHYTKADYATTYSTARTIAQFVSFVGWAVVAISLLIFLISIVVSLDSHRSFALMGLFPSIAGVISGLLLVMAGQMTRATVDTADNTGHMLAIMKTREYK